MLLNCTRVPYMHVLTSIHPIHQSCFFVTPIAETDPSTKEKPDLLPRKITRHH